MNQYRTIDDPMIRILVESSFLILFLFASIALIVGVRRKVAFLISPPEKIRNNFIYRLLNQLGDKAIPKFHLFLGYSFLIFSVFILISIINDIKILLD